MLIVYDVVLATLLFLSMRENQTVLFYFGFLRGKFSKTLFLLFCSCIVLPTENTGSSSGDSTINELVGGFLMVVALL